LSHQIILVLLQLIIISPILFFTLTNKKRDTFYTLIVFILFVFLNHILVYSYTLKAFHFFNQNWNWSGKVLAICGSIIFLIFYKKYPINEYGITLHQKPKSIRISIVVLAVFVFATILIGLFASQKTNFNLETLSFQLTLPGIDEELAFRGIMIGLLSQILVEHINISYLKFINPSILITSILFGLDHAFNFDKNLNLSLDFIMFLQIFLMGIVMGWIFVRSKSILFPMIIHNISNTLMVLIPMLL
jgi:CAAX protease family protein